MADSTPADGDERARDPDDDVLAELGRVSPEEARDSLVYWRERLETLPRSRRSARTEARGMVATWERRLLEAEIEQRGGGLTGAVAGRIAVLRTLGAGALARRLVPRWLVVGALTFVLATFVVMALVIAIILSLLF